MVQTSAYNQLRQLDSMIKRLSITDKPETTTAAWRSYEALKRAAMMAVDRMRDYELSSADEDVAMQAKTLPPAIVALEQLRTSLLKASEYDLLGPAEIAQISARLDELIDTLK